MLRKLVIGVLILALGMIIGVLIMGLTGTSITQIIQNPPWSDGTSDGTSTEPDEYGTPPGGPAPEEIEVPEGYPYLAELPPGAEGKVQLAYNYGVSSTGSRLYKMKFTNLFNRTVEEVMIYEFAKDRNGKVIELGGFGGEDIKPGKSWYPGMTGGLAEQDYELYELTSPVIFWLEVTYIKFK